MSGAAAANALTKKVSATKEILIGAGLAIAVRCRAPSLGAVTRSANASRLSPLGAARAEGALPSAGVDACAPLENGLLLTGRRT